jgi:hypothetical protein
MYPSMAWSLNEYRRPLRSNNKLWAAITVCLFLLGWIIPLAGRNTHEPLGLLWVMLFRHDYLRPVSEMLIPLVAITFVLAAISSIIGLMAQLLVCAIVDHRRARRQQTAGNPEQANPENAS